MENSQRRLERCVLLHLRFRSYGVGLVVKHWKTSSSGFAPPPPPSRIGCGDSGNRGRTPFFSVPFLGIREHDDVNTLRANWLIVKLSCRRAGQRLRNHNETDSRHSALTLRLQHEHLLLRIQLCRLVIESGMDTAIDLKKQWENGEKAKNAQQNTRETFRLGKKT